MNTIFINDTEFTEDTGGLDEFVVTHLLDDDTNTVSIAVSESLTFTGEAYDFLNDLFFSDCDGFKSVAEVEVYISCCDKTYNFQINYKGIEIDVERCSIIARLVRDSDEIDCAKQLKNTIFWRKKGQLDQGFLDYTNHPRVHFCNQLPTFLVALFFILRVAMFPILRLLQTIEDVINTIASILPGVGKETFNIPSLDNFDKALTGCGRYHVAPLIRDIVNYQAERCGIQFVSSILTSFPYKNTALFTAQYEKGYKDGDNKEYNADNAPNLTVFQILDLISPHFNADYRIINGKLYFERIDFFDDFNTDTIDLSEVDLQYEFEEVQGYAYGRYEYIQDTFDQEGNKAFHIYSDIVDWNDPPDDWQTGELTNVVRTAPSSFVHDRVSLRGGFRMASDLWRSNNTFFIGNQSEKVTDHLVMTNDLASEYKLIVLEQGYNWKNAKAIKRQILKKVIGPNTGIGILDKLRQEVFWDYNYPMYFDEKYPERELYQRFHHISDPRKRGFVYYVIPSISVSLNCERVELVDNNSINLNIETSIGTGKAESIDVDYGNNEIVFNNIRVKCSA